MNRVYYWTLLGIIKLCQYIFGIVESKLTEEQIGNLDSWTAGLKVATGKNAPTT